MSHDYFSYRQGGRPDLTGVRRLLLIQLGDIGDVLYTFPCARAAKESLAGVVVAMAVQQKAAGLLACCPWVDEVVAVDKAPRSMAAELAYQKGFWQRLRRFSFDLAVDLRTGTRGAIMARLSGAPLRLGRYTPHGRLWRNRLFSHLVLPAGRMNQYIAEYYLDTVAAYGMTTDRLDPELVISAVQEEAAARLLQAAGVAAGRPLVALQPFSLWGYKELALEKYVELSRRLDREFGLEVVLVGSPAEGERCGRLAATAGGGVHNLAGVTTLAELGALFRRCVLFVGVDSAGLHIAAAAGTPTVGIYGPSAAEIWAPRGDRQLVVRKDWPCVPCKETGCQASMRSRCLDELTVTEIVSAMEPLLARVR